MAINEKLKFSWGHIIAFVAIIVISYFSFLGLTYLTDGNFMFTGIGVSIIDVMIALAFIGAQVAKGTDHKFKKTIVLERILVAVAPLILIAMMYPTCHFWTVFGHRYKIEENFHSSIESSKEMFTEYEKYAKKRCTEYSELVSKSNGTQMNKKDRILALSLQLKDKNFTTLKDEAIAWVEKAKGATVWNVFMIANIKTIKYAIISWHEQLVGFSKKKMSDEPTDVANFDSDSATLSQITANLDGIKHEYSIKGAPTPYAIIMILLCYLLLMFPYTIQQRNSKSLYHLFYNEGHMSGSRIILADNPTSKNTTFEEDEDFFTIEERPAEEKQGTKRGSTEGAFEPTKAESKKPDRKEKLTKVVEDDDFDSFTM